MTPSEFAERSGLSVNHVRLMIRRGRIRARKRAKPEGSFGSNQHGFEYSITERELERYNREGRKVGRPKKEKAK